MRYRVYFEDSALRNVDETLGWMLRTDAAPERARAWLEAIEHAAESLSSLAGRGAHAPEGRQLGRAIRQLPVGRGHWKFRLLYEIRGDAVYILHIVHRARMPGSES